jgi:hypothetical protein
MPRRPHQHDADDEPSDDDEENDEDGETTGEVTACYALCLRRQTVSKPDDGSGWYAYVLVEWGADAKGERSWMEVESLRAMQKIDGLHGDSARIIKAFLRSLGLRGLKKLIRALTKAGDAPSFDWGSVTKDATALRNAMTLGVVMSIEGDFANLPSPQHTCARLGIAPAPPSFYAPAPASAAHASASAPRSRPASSASASAAASAAFGSAFAAASAASARAAAGGRSPRRTPFSSSSASVPARPVPPHVANALQMLRLRPDASRDQIHAACRAVALQTHPDRSGGSAPHFAAMWNACKIAKLFADGGV